MDTGDDSVPTGVLPNNGIGIIRDVSTGLRIYWQCRSGSTMTGVGQLVDLDGNTFNIGEDSRVFRVENTRGEPGTVSFQNVIDIEPALGADDEGVYSCRIPDESGAMVDVNIGVYQNGFNSEFDQ